MKKEKIICVVCDGQGCIGPDICKSCRGTGKVYKKEKQAEPEQVRHSLTVDEWVEMIQRKRGIIK
mgnify:FL=1